MRGPLHDLYTFLTTYKLAFATYKLFAHRIKKIPKNIDKSTFLGIYTKSDRRGSNKRLKTPQAQYLQGVSGTAGNRCTTKVHLFVKYFPK